MLNAHPIGILPADPAVESDLFLACVRVVSSHYGRSVAATVLTAGLPLEDGHLSLALLPKAVERVGLIADIRRARIKRLIRLDTPAVVIRKDGRPLVLLKESKRHSYSVYVPETNVIEEICFSSLNAQYSGLCACFKAVYATPQGATGIPLKEQPGSWFWNVAREYYSSYSTVILAACVINMIALAIPLFIMNVYDRVLPNKAMATLWVFVCGLVIALLFDLALKIARAQIIDRVGRKIDIQVACNLIEKILSTRLVDRAGTSGVLANRMQEYEIVREFFSSNTLMLFVDLMFFSLFSIVIYWLGGWIVMVPIVALISVVLFGLMLQNRLSDVVRRAQDESALRHSVLVESVAGLETIKSVRAEGHILRRWEKYARAAADSSEQAKYLSSVALNATAFAQQLVTVLVVVVGVYQFSDGNMSMGAIIAVVMLSNRLVAPLSQIALTFSRIHYVRLAFKHFDDIMSKQDETISQTGFVNRRIDRGTIELKDVEFAYPGATSPVLRSLRLIINSGERVGIIGRIGSGKTTLGRLLTGLYQPTKGELLLDGVDIRQYHPHEVRKAIALVVQEADLFYGSVRDNIVMSNPVADDDDIVRAAKLAGVDEFVSANPRGYDMPVGERGSQLSGGQRQCIALARVFLNDPRVLFLDEPSSSMDLQSERQLIDRLRSAIQPHQTVIIATHRQSMLQLVDRLLVIEKGVIIRDGPRDEVLQGLRQASLVAGGKAVSLPT